jgi:alpha-tubulin suppressor-like RCC1 family protein
MAGVAGQGGNAGEGGGGMAGGGGMGGAIVSNPLLATAVALGENNGCAVEKGGQTYCWGDNTNLWVSQSAERIGRKARLTGLALPTAPTQISLGFSNACVLGQDAKAYCWGENNHKEIGSDDSTTQPATVALQGVTQLALSSHASCAVAQSKAYCWGSNSENSLGDASLNTTGAPFETAMPQLIKLPPAAVVSGIQAYAGGSLICALASPNLYCWGEGLPSPQNITLPALPETFAVAYNKVYAVTANGVYSTSIQNAASMAPELEGPLSSQGKIKQIIGSYHVCILTEAGQVFCKPPGTDQLEPEITGFSGKIVSLAAGFTNDPEDGFECALLESGEVQCWGHNQYGSLGQGSPEIHRQPQFVGSGGLELETSYRWTIGHIAGQKAVLWGRPPHYFQHSDGPDFLKPTPRAELDGVTRLRTRRDPGRLAIVTGDQLAMVDNEGNPLNPAPFAAGSYLDAYPDNETDLALRADGTVWASVNGSISTPDPHFLSGTDSPVAGPQQIVIPTQAKFSQLLKAWEVSGSLHACALGSGELWCWGNNSQHQVSPSTSMVNPDQGTDHEPPVQIVIPGQTITQACAGSAHTCALTQSGQVFCWGTDDQGECSGIVGHYADVISPTLLDTQETFQAIGCGVHHTCAVLQGGGGVRCWGNNTYGQMGDGSEGQASGLHTVAFPSISNITSLAVGYQHACVIHEGDKVSCWGDSSFGQVGGGRDSFLAGPTIPVQKLP